MSWFTGDNQDDNIIDNKHAVYEDSDPGGV